MSGTSQYRPRKVVPGGLHFGRSVYTPSGSSMTHVHYPPLGVTEWTCPECGVALAKTSGTWGVRAEGVAA